MFVYISNTLWRHAIYLSRFFQCCLTGCHTTTTGVTKKNRSDANSWWRHRMETFSALLALCEGNPPVTAGFPSQKPVPRSFDVFFDLCLNKRLSKQSRRRWFETPSRSLWRNCNVLQTYNKTQQITYNVHDYRGVVYPELTLCAFLTRHECRQRGIPKVNAKPHKHVYEVLVNVTRILEIRKAFLKRLTCSVSEVIFAPMSTHCSISKITQKWSLL